MAASALVHDDYVTFCEGVHGLCHIDLLQYKRGQMERRVRAFAQRRGHQGLAPYLTLLVGDTGARDEFLDRVTINVSNLWRNPEQWAHLQAEIVPALAADGTLRAWSAGCSFGAEAYTLAAVCRLAAPSARISILGTDIDRRAIERARVADFNAEDVRDAPPAALARFFSGEGERWQPIAELRALVSFELGDLLRLRPPVRSYDLVLCRNTVIYFNADARDALHERLASALRPGGVLVVGATERVTAPGAIGLQALAPFTYIKA
ncbi:MAG: CheR family methyltransferase [Solirubrobacteraceae bacterium]